MPEGILRRLGTDGAAELSNELLPNEEVSAEPFVGSEPLLPFQPHFS